MAVVNGVCFLLQYFIFSKTLLLCYCWTLYLLPGQHLNKVCKGRTLLIKFACTSHSVTNMLSLGVRMKPHAWIQGKNQITKCLTLSSRQNNIKHIEQNKRHFKKNLLTICFKPSRFCVFYIHIGFYIYWFGNFFFLFF